MCVNERFILLVRIPPLVKGGLLVVLALLGRGVLAFPAFLRGFISTSVFVKGGWVGAVGGVITVFLREGFALTVRNPPFVKETLLSLLREVYYF